MLSAVDIDPYSRILYIARERTFIQKISSAVHRVSLTGPIGFLLFLSILDILSWRLLLA